MRPDPGSRTRRALAAVALAALLGASGRVRATAEPPAVPDPDPWLGTAGASLSGVSDDGAVVVFRRQHEGVLQLFRTDGRGAPAVLVTKRKDPVDFAVLSPDGTQAVVGYDEGGDEDDGLWLVGVGPGRDGVERPLSTAKGVQHGSVVWAEAGDRIFFRSNAASRKDFHLHEMRLADGAVRTVLARPGSWNVQDVDAEGKRLLVGHERSNHDSSVHLLDLASGETKEVAPAPPGTRSATRSARFVGAGDEVVFLSDRGAAGLRWPYLASPGDGKVRELVRCGMNTPRGCTGCPRDVDEVVPTHDGASAYLVENKDGFGVLYRVDVASGEDAGAPVSLPPGVAGGVRVDRAGRSFFTASGPTAPASVVRWDGAESSPVVLAPPELGDVPRDAFPAPPRLVSYPTFDGKTVPAWLHLPRGAAKGPIPFVVNVHGGPEGQERPTFSPDRSYLLSLGYGVLSPNVRGSTGYGREYRDLDDYRKRLDAVRDVKAGAEWLAREGLADPKRIAVVGGSYGGYVVLACLTEFPDTFAAGVDVVGIANFETFLERTAPYRRALREAEYGPLSDREFLRSISPIHKVDRIRAPLLVAHGENDPRVPVHEARQIEAALRARDVPVRALYFPDEGHGWQKRENRRTYLRAVAEFLRDTLGS